MRGEEGRKGRREKKRATENERDDLNFVAEKHSSRWPGKKARTRGLCSSACEITLKYIAVAFDADDPD